MPNHILPHLNQFLRDQQFTLHITANFNRPHHDLCSGKGQDQNLGLLR